MSSAGKRQRDARRGQQASPIACEGPAVNKVVTIAAIESKVLTITGKLGGAKVDILLDSGSSISLVRKAALRAAENVSVNTPTTIIQLVTASGEQLKVVDYVTAPVHVGDRTMVHNFIVVDKLITAVILGVDFMQKHGLVLDFSHTPVQVVYNINKGKAKMPDELSKFLPIIQKAKSKIHSAVAAVSRDEDVVEECAVPKFGNLMASFDLPECPRPELRTVVDEFKTLFRTLPGKTDKADHYIPTTGPPVRVPPRRIPEQYRPEVEGQIKSMLQQGIIEESSSPWMAPAVYVEKKSGDIRLCVDYRELNKSTKKDAYPLSLPDEVQGQMAGATIFSTLDLQSGYWQLPVCILSRTWNGVVPVYTNAIRPDRCPKLLSTSDGYSDEWPALC